MNKKVEMNKELSLILDKVFVNQRDSYGLQQPNGTYRREEKLLTPKLLEQHLRGELTAGAYQLNKENMVKWLCFDIDPQHIEDPLTTAKNILSVCLEEDIEEDGKKRPRIWPKAILLEASRYPDNSIHLWIFFEPLLPAKVARWLGVRIIELANVNPKQVEIFPKQTELTEALPYGNCVKLPLGFHREQKKWSRFLNLETFEPLPSSCLFSVEGINFSEENLQRILSFDEKKDVQTKLRKLSLPANYEPLEDEEENKLATFLAKYWRAPIPGKPGTGKRNKLEIAFLGWCLKKGVAFESAYRVIEQVCQLTGTSGRDTRIALQKVRYHYQKRRGLGSKLLGISGIKEILLEALS